MVNTKEIIARMIISGKLGSRRHDKEISNDEIDIVLAWFWGEIETGDLVRLYGGGPTPGVYRAACVLRDLAIEGKRAEILDLRKENYDQQVRQRPLVGPKEHLRPGDPGYDPAFDVNAKDDDW